MPLFNTQSGVTVKHDTSRVTAAKLNTPYITGFFLPKRFIGVVSKRAVKTRLITLTVSAENHALGYKKVFPAPYSPKPAALEEHGVTRRKVFRYIL